MVHATIGLKTCPQLIRSTLWTDRQHSHNLRSATTTLCQPSKTTTFAKRAYQFSAPAVWNSLPKTVLNNDCVAVFKSRLKTFLFSQAFSSSFSCVCVCLLLVMHQMTITTLHTMTTITMPSMKTSAHYGAASLSRYNNILPHVLCPGRFDLI